MALASDAITESGPGALSPLRSRPLRRVRCGPRCQLHGPLAALRLDEPEGRRRGPGHATMGPVRMLVSQGRYALTACMAAAMVLTSLSGSAEASSRSAQTAGAKVKICSHSMRVGGNQATGVEANVKDCKPITKLVRSYLAHPGVAPKGWKRIVHEIPGAGAGESADFVELRQIHGARGKGKVFVLFTFAGS